jgi:hypothetical protein
MASETEGDAILTEWAEVERILTHTKRQLEGLPPGSQEAASLRAEVDRLIDEWGRLWDRSRS